MSTFKSFENDTQSITIGEGNGITFENGTDEIIVYGDTTFDKDTDPATIDSLLEILTGIKNKLTQKSSNKMKK